MAVEDVEDAEDVEEGDSAREADPVCLGAQTLHAEIHAWLDTVAPGDPGPAPLDSEHSAAADADDAAGFLSAWSQTNAFYNRIGKENAAHKGDGAFGRRDERHGFGRRDEHEDFCSQTALHEFCAREDLDGGEVGGGGGVAGGPDLVVRGGVWGGGGFSVPRMISHRWVRGGGTRALRRRVWLRLGVRGGGGTRERTSGGVIRPRKMRPRVLLPNTWVLMSRN